LERRSLPTVAAELDGGLGGPSFYFYPPLPFFVAALFQPLFGASDPWHALRRVIGARLVLSGIFAFLWLRETSMPAARRSRRYCS
jgi:uncharacterized membrane protein